MQGLTPLTLTLLALLTVPGAPAGPPVAAQQEIQCKKALEAGDVASLLEAGVSNPRVKLIVTTCKVDFELTDALEKRFRSLGATAEILLAITRNYQVHVRTLTGHSWLVRSVAFSPDGRFLASGSHDNTIKLWDPQSGRELRTLTGHRSLVLSVAFSPDGSILASGSADNTIKLWEVASGRELRTLAGHSDYVESVAFSPDGRFLASGSHDKTLKLWRRVEE